MVKKDSKYLRKNPPTPEEFKNIKRNPIYFVLDNVLDTYNIGSMFRLADAVAAQKVYICGESEYPPSSRIHKAAVGTEEWVAWIKVSKVSETIKSLKKQGVQIIAVEQDPRSISFSNLNSQLQFPIAIVVGHESNGVSKEVLDLADVVVEIPMFGVNKSLNVWGSAAIISYKILEKLSSN